MSRIDPTNVSLRLGDYTTQELENLSREFSRQADKNDAKRREHESARDGYSIARLKIEAEIERRHIPLEPEVGTIINFSRFFGRKKYDYAGLRADDGMWYITGMHNGPMTWQELVAFIRQSESTLSTLRVNAWYRNGSRYRQIEVKKQEAF